MVKEKSDSVILNLIKEDITTHDIFRITYEVDDGRPFSLWLFKARVENLQIRPTQVLRITKQVMSYYKTSISVRSRDTPMKSRTKQ